MPLRDFSSLRFLKLLEKKKSRRVNIRQIILLAIRTLAIVAIVLVFLRPALDLSGSSGGSTDPVEMIVIADDAIHTSLETRDGALSSELPRQIKWILENRNRDDNLTFIRTTQPDQFISGANSLIHSELSETNCLLTGQDIPGLLQVVDSILAQSFHFRKEIYIVSTFYGEVWDSLNLAGDDPTVFRYLIPLGVQQSSNLAIEKAEIQSAIIQKGEPIDIQVQLRNNSPQAADQVLVNLWVNDKRVGYTTLSLPANGVKSHTFSYTSNEVGRLECLVSLESSDGFGCDDNFFLVLNIPDSLRVFAVARSAVDQRLIQSAFAGKSTDHVKLKWHSPGSWQSASFKGYDALLLFGIQQTSNSINHRISGFVKKGGGLVLGFDEELDIPNLNRGLLKQLKLGSILGVSGEESKNWKSPDFSHPVFSGMFDDTPNIKSPSFRNSVRWQGSKHSIPIIRYSDGSSLLAESIIDNGRVIVLTSPIDPGNSDFAFSGIFAPLFYRLISYVANPQSDGAGSWTTCEAKHVTMPLDRAELLKLHIPGGDFLDLTPTPVIGGMELQVPPLQFPGFYRLNSEGKTAAGYAVNAPRGFSELRRKNIGDLEKQLHASTLEVEQPSELREVIYGNRLGREIWFPIAVILLLLLIAESVIGRGYRTAN